MKVPFFFFIFFISFIWKFCWCAFAIQLASVSFNKRQESEIIVLDLQFWNNQSKEEEEEESHLPSLLGWSRHSGNSRPPAPVRLVHQCSFSSLRVRLSEWGTRVRACAFTSSSVSASSCAVVCLVCVWVSEWMCLLCKFNFGVAYYSPASSSSTSSTESIWRKKTTTKHLYKIFKQLNNSKKHIR